MAPESNWVPRGWKLTAQMALVAPAFGKLLELEGLGSGLMQVVNDGDGVLAARGDKVA